MRENKTVGGLRPVTATARAATTGRPSALSALLPIAMAGLLAVGMAACSAPPQSPEDRAREVAERWVAASKAGDDDAAYAVACAGVDPRMGVNSDTADFESHTLNIEQVGEGEFNVKVTASYPDYPDLVSNLRVRTEGDACVAWVR